MDGSERLRKLVEGFSQIKAIHQRDLLLSISGLMNVVTRPLPCPGYHDDFLTGPGAGGHHGAALQPLLLPSYKKAFCLSPGIYFPGKIAVWVW